MVHMLLAYQIFEELAIAFVRVCRRNRGRSLADVETPIIKEHQAITEDFVPRSDLVLFITSADRPFTESERTFLEGIRDWGKKIAVAVNKVDILESETDVVQVVDFVAQNFHKLLGVTPDIFPVSSVCGSGQIQLHPVFGSKQRCKALETNIGR